MFISLYTNKRLKSLKQYLFVTGLLLVTGGAFAAAREVLERAVWRPEWIAAAVVIIAIGVLCVSISRNIIPLKDAYFLMNPSRLSYRLTLFGKEKLLQWTEIAAIRVTDTKIVFELRNEREITLRLSTIPDEEVARHIRASISLAALEQNIKVNGVLSRAHKMA